MIVIIVSRGQLNRPPLTFGFVVSMYLAEPVTFGGGPVVIPLRPYAVGPGWGSSSDFLVSLAIIQAFPWS
jgi:hypothetical protein